MIRQRFNVVVQRTVMELQGTPCIALEDGTSYAEMWVTTVD